MRAVKSKVTKGLPIGAFVDVVDNSGARIIQIVSVRGYKTRTRTLAAAGVGDLVTATVTAGKPDMKGQVFDAVVIRQKKPYRRKTGERVCFEDNAVTLLKDDKGNPKGTQIKGPVAREVQERWPSVAKIAQFVL